MSEQILFKIAGLSHEADTIGPGTDIRKLLASEKAVKLKLERRPDNPHDSNAIKLIFEGRDFGWIPNSSHGSRMADVLAPVLDKGSVSVSVEATKCFWDDQTMAYKCHAVLTVEE